LYKVYRASDKDKPTAQRVLKGGADIAERAWIPNQNAADKDDIVLCSNTEHAIV
jgi:hypothetical protein